MAKKKKNPYVWRNTTRMINSERRRVRVRKNPQTGNEEVQVIYPRKGMKLTRKRSRQHTAKKGGPSTIIGYPSKKGKGPYNVEYKNTPRQRRKHLDTKIG